MLSSGVEITGVEGTVSTQSLLEQLDRQRSAGSWAAFVRTNKQLGMLERQTVYLRATEIIGVINDETTFAVGGPAVEAQHPRPGSPPTEN